MNTVIVATANTMEQYEDYTHTLGVFSSVESFENWLYDCYHVSHTEPPDSFSKFKTYYIYDKNTFERDGYHFYKSTDSYTDEDGKVVVDVYESQDHGEYVDLKEFIVL